MVLARVFSRKRLQRFLCASLRASLRASLTATAVVSLTSASLFAQTAGGAGAARSARERPASSASGALPATPSAGTSLSGTLGPDAARVLSGNPVPRSGTGALGIAPPVLGPSRHRPLSVGQYVPIMVTDAPAYGRGSSTLMVQPLSPPQVTAPSFYPTTEPPTWTIVKEEHPVQAWRLVDVDDTICDASGSCTRVRTRMQARWMAALAGYAFRDRIGRVWRVE